MNYQEAINYIETTHRFGRVLGLANITKLLELLGNPQDELKFIHIAGTNGKGSTCSYISNILKESGYKIGLFTSPYLESFTERIRVNGENIKEDKLAQITDIIKEKIELMVLDGGNHPTEFEIVTAMAIYYYKQENVDFVVFEVGLGGRFDATNIIKNPVVSVITPISLDHVDYLGDTVEKIAYEKAGIIKEKSPVVIYPQKKSVKKVIEDIANEMKSPIYEANLDTIDIKSSSLRGQIFDCMVRGQKYENLETRLIGTHQVNNALVALNVIEVMKENNIAIKNEAIYKGLKETKWPGRVELFEGQPLVIIDGAHNLDGANSLNDVIEKYLKDKKINFVVGMLKDKDVDGVLNLLVPNMNKIIATKPDSDRAIEPLEIIEKIKSIDNSKDVICIEDIDQAIEKALKDSKEDEIVLCAGSLYMIGHVRSIIKNR